MEDNQIESFPFMSLPLDLVRFTISLIPPVLIFPVYFVSKTLSQIAKEHETKDKSTLPLQFAIYCANHGHLNAIIWAVPLIRNVHCPYSGWTQDNTRLYNLGWWRSISETAAKNNHIDIVKWGYENKYPVGRVVCSAARSGHINIIQWAMDVGLEHEREAPNYAAEGGQFEALKWLVNGGHNIDWRTLKRAAANGDLQMVEWCRERKCQFDHEVATAAAENGHFEMLKWLRKNGCSWTEGTIAGAAKSGHFEIVKWLHKKGCPYDHRVRRFALNTEIAEWAEDNGYPN